MKRPSCAIAFANPRACGRTTLIANLAIRCGEESSRVILLDYDPQQTLGRWAERRGRGDVKNPRVRDNWHRAGEHVRTLKSHGAEWIFLDLPHGTFHLKAGIDASDFVIIPVSAIFYLDGEVDPVIQICKQFGKPFAFLMTMYDPKRKRSEMAITDLERKAPGHTLPEVFSYQQAYRYSMIGGQTGPEYENVEQAKAARAEVDALWKAVKKRALGSARVPGPWRAR
jgi:chromosome partitioning protein